MSNLILATPLIGDAATLTGSPVAATLPLSNLKRQAIGAVARFLTPAGAYIQIDLGSTPQAIDLIALLGHNASVSGAVQIRGADSIADLTDNPAYDSGVLRMRSNVVAPDYNDVGSLARNHCLHQLDAPATLRYWRIDMSDSAMQYLDVGRLYVSKVFQPDVNMDYGLQEGYIDPSSIRRTVGGRVSMLERPKYRFVEFTLSFASEAEMFGALFEIDRLRGATRDVLFVHDYDNKPLIQKRTVYGHMATLNPVTHPYFQLFEKTIRIEQIAE